MQQMPKPHVTLTGAAIGLTALDGLTFDPSYPHAGCRICGAVYQTPRDRLASPTPEQRYLAYETRNNWRIDHAKTHSSREHAALALSGLWCTPEAAQVLAPLGVIPLTDTARSDETEHALRTAYRAPLDDTEGFDI